MKKLTALFLVAFTGLMMLAFTTPAFAAEKVTITGEGKCAKCALHETDKCQTVITADKDGKPVNYYLVDNKTSKGFHKTVCEAPKKVTATGTVKEVDGKLQFTASKIEEAK